MCTGEAREKTMTTVFQAVARRIVVQ